jgi:DNA-binding SARP family transcriptional activator
MRTTTALLSGPPASAMTRFLLLGPVEVGHDGGRLALGRRRERCLLAVLLLEANRVVPADRLEDLLWDGFAPASARASLHTHVSRLRAHLDPDGNGRHGVRLHARDGGYLVEVERGAVDAHLFTDMVERARSTTDAAARAAMLRRGLTLWRGPALADAGSDLLRHRVAADLDELRVIATEQALDAELECGRHDEVVGEVKRLITEHPLREGLWGRLALALYRAGRQAEALETLALARHRLAGELGIDPGPGLRRLQHEILTADPVLEAVASASTPLGAPRQLPMDIEEFTGREAELCHVETLAGAALAGAATARPTVPVICAIEGMAGVGKTRFAVHAAHRLARRFDEVQLWADLHGLESRRPPADPAAVLETFLRLLGVPGCQVPDGLEARSALYRSRLAGRRTLVLLDNAAGADQVRPLLPGGGSCLVLVTTRRRLSSMDGVRPVPLDVFSPAEATALLAGIAGGERVGGQPAEATHLARLCGHLPLAVALAARHLRAHPSWTVRDLVARLTPEDRRLSELSVRGETVRAAFDLSYRALPPPQRRLFRLLGRHRGDDITADAAAGLTGQAPEEAGVLLDALLDEYLLQERVPGRYRMHDLIRRYAIERARDEGPE